ncbi:FAD-dependent oxidoreductase [Rathayibacter soli]|uniref:FAD-dependent oxidoreductase n=1 Tax=Rathayibacter soli TaxID=3144168 RepID=UPI0027E3BEC9|nr:FAD-binding protein [Glaciibacter superstes]
MIADEAGPVSEVDASGPHALRRVRPADAEWPTASEWAALGKSLAGQLLPVTSPLESCVGADAAATDPVFRALKNPYYIGDTPGLTQTTGWLDAWTTQPSAFAVAAETPGDVAAAVNFASEHALRLVIRGGGHSYQGTSCAPDSLLIWTRRMNALTTHDAFVGAGCDGAADSVPAVSLGAGCLWGPTYDTVTRQHGRYVQGGGCLTVGVAGLIQSGGFGSFSKRYGTAAGSLLEAEVVTADGAIHVVNACQDPELFWGLKGGGGGSLGVVTRVTLQTHGLPEHFGHVSASIAADSDQTFRALIARVVDFYADNLFNEHWGEQLHVVPDRSVVVSMAQAGLDDATVHGIWDPFFAEVRLNGEAIDAAMAEVYRLVPKQDAGAYVSESNYFDTDWRHSYWGSNYARLQAVKKTYDPQGLFFVHNGVGSEQWSADGFTRL